MSLTYQEVGRYLVGAVISDDLDDDNHVISFNDRNNYMNEVGSMSKVCGNELGVGNEVLVLENIVGLYLMTSLSYRHGQFLSIIIVYYSPLLVIKYS